MKITEDPRLHWYAARFNPTKRDPTGVVDGDTFNITLDLGDFIYVQKALRLYGINAPEMSTPEGKDAKAWAIGWAENHCPDGMFIVKTGLDPEGKYGRILGTVYAPDGACFNTDIVAAGHAVVYLP